MAARTIPVSATRATGNEITASAWNAGPVASNTFLTLRPLFSDFTSTSTAANGAIVASPLATSAQVSPPNFTDTDGGYSSSLATRYTCQVPGWYIVMGNAGWPQQTAGQRMALIRKNGADIQAAAAECNQSGGNAALATPVTLVHLVQGDYVELYTFQNSGVGLTIGQSPNGQGALYLQWISS